MCIDLVIFSTATTGEPNVFKCYKGQAPSLRQLVESSTDGSVNGSGSQSRKKLHVFVRNFRLEQSRQFTQDLITHKHF